MGLSYVKAEPVSLKIHPELNELWLRDLIREDPIILGLGELEVKDAERMQPKAGRIDLLLRDPETDTRYEVELMLGSTDESHIIRCIEYWDIERKRYPQYDHIAVLVAEDVTTRFLNVISLFNSAIPIIAIQVSALKVDDRLTLNFVKVLDLLIRGEDDEDDQGGGQTDRAYWEKKASKDSLQIADGCLEILKSFEPSLSLKFNKNYIGLYDGFRSRNFVLFRAKKQVFRIEARISEQDEWVSLLEDKGIEVLPGQKKRARLVFRIAKTDLAKNQDLLKSIFEAAHNESLS